MNTSQNVSFFHFVAPEILIECQQLEIEIGLCYPHYSQFIEMNAKAHANIAQLQENVQKEYLTAEKGRGGNNIAQNVKKSLLSILKNHLPYSLLLFIKQKCIQRHRLKSQKEAIIVIVMYLYKLVNQNLLSLEKLKEIVSLLHSRIKKFHLNSQRKLEQQPHRKEFHMKNIEEFNKFLQMDLDFTYQKPFQVLSKQLKSLYRRKHTEFLRSLKRVIDVIISDHFFQNLFTDLSEPIKQEEPQTELFVKRESQ